MIMISVLSKFSYSASATMIFAYFVPMDEDIQLKYLIIFKFLNFWIPIVFEDSNFFFVMDVNFKNSMV